MVLLRNDKRKLVLAAVVAVCTVGVLSGCDKLPARQGGRGSEGEEEKILSPREVLQSVRSHLAVIDTTWEESQGVLGGWKAKGMLSTGMIVASDGQRALVLTSRRAVDPQYGRGQAGRTRNVVFRVSTPGQRTAGEMEYARLVSLYMNGVDLALLSMPSPGGESFIVEVADTSGLRAGDSVVAVGQPSGAGFGVTEAIISNFWHGGWGGKTLEVSVAPGWADSLGPLFTRKGAKLAGMMSGTPQSPAGNAVGSATPADYLFRADNWDYLMEEGPTRELLRSLRRY